MTTPGWRECRREEPGGGGSVPTTVGGPEGPPTFESEGTAEPGSRTRRLLTPVVA
jgi:hypothetical protein